MGRKPIDLKLLLAYSRRNQPVLVPRSEVQRTLALVDAGYLERRGPYDGDDTEDLRVTITDAGLQELARQRSRS